MQLEVFELERIQSEWEHLVRFNLTESGVEPLKISELVSEDQIVNWLADTKLGYSQTNGTIPLRELISSLFPGTDADNVIVTNGGAEANFLSVWNLLNENPERNEIVTMLPNYMQIHGLCKALGGIVKPFYLRTHDDTWVPDIEGLKEAVTSKTIAISICNPNNPTGAVLHETQLKAIAEIADEADAWIISDEIYRGAEIGGPMTPSMFELHDKVLVTSSLSKVYGLPGLRLGWIVSIDKDIIKGLWSYSDYTTICPSKLSDMLATVALRPDIRARLLERTMNKTRNNWEIMRDWLDTHSDIFEYVVPRAGPFCFPKYNLNIGSVDLVYRLIHEKSVLIVPGDHFGMSKHLRIGFGYGEDNLRSGLGLIGELIQTIK
ncbi:MAG: aminotransferase class I/II-fold pyridoxal phosphate-dependent enzyme [Candidatus Thorarchaeota archaeon]|nr:MAG: aminotransferase class I/II-fold pyridoxal phosphate-dependent enzyme [Candidatus Thorarchaeota archaeon]